MAAGETGFATILGDELHEQTFGAGLRMFRIVEVKASGRILKNKIGTPGKALRLSVPATIDEGKFGPQNLENVAPVRHRENPRGMVSRWEERGEARNHQVA